MSKTFKDSPENRRNRGGPGRSRARQRNISVRAVRRNPPDYRKLSKALIQLAMAEAEAEARTTSESPTEAAPADTPADEDQRD